MFLKLDIIMDVPQDNEIIKTDNGWWWNGQSLTFENFQDKAAEITYNIDLIQFDEYGQIVPPQSQ